METVKELLNHSDTTRLSKKKYILSFYDDISYLGRNIDKKWYQFWKPTFINRIMTVRPQMVFYAEDRIRDIRFESIGINGNAGYNLQLEEDNAQTSYIHFTDKYE